MTSRHLQFFMDVGKAIRLLRTNLGLAQGALARRAGISASYLSLIEKGRREPTLQLLKVLARELGVSPAILLAVSKNAKDQPKELRRLHDDFQRLFSLILRKS